MRLACALMSCLSELLAKLMQHGACLLILPPSTCAVALQVAVMLQCRVDSTNLLQIYREG